MFAAKSTGIFLCFLLAVTLCSGKHTLHVDDVLSSATSTVVLRELQSDVFTVDNLDLDFIDLNLQGENNFIMDTLGPLSFDGSFIDFSSPAYVNIRGEAEGRLETTGTASLSGDSLTIDAQRFILSTGGDIFMNTDGSLNGNSHRTGINSLTHTEVAVASGPMELLSGDDLEISATHVELIGDDRISLYSFNSLTVDSHEDFQAYSAFIDFDSYGDIRLTTSTGNIHVDTIRDVVFEAEDISFSAPMGVEFQSEHGEIYVDAADRFYADSADVLLLETIDEARFVAEDGFTLESADLSISTSDLIKFHAKTLEIVFSDAVFQSHDTEVLTGGDINFLLNSSQSTSYSMGAKNGIDFQSRNIRGVSSGDLTFETMMSGDISLSASSVFDSSLILNTNDLTVTSEGDSTITAPVIRLDAERVEFNALSVDMRADSSLGDEFNANAPGDVVLNADFRIANSIAESGTWNANDVSFSASDITLQSGELVDERIDIVSDAFINIFSANLVAMGADQTIISHSDDIDILSQGGAASFLMASYGLLDIVIGDHINLNAGDQILFELEELIWEISGIYRVSSSTSTTFSAAEFDLWANQFGDFSAGNSIEFSSEESMHFQAFRDIIIENISEVNADEVIFEATESASISVNGAQNYETSGVLEIASGALFGINYNGNEVMVTATNDVSFDAGFLSLIASDDFIINASTFNVETDYEEDIRLTAGDTFSWDLGSGVNFVNSADDVLFSANDDLTLTSGATTMLAINQGVESFVEDDFTSTIGGDTVLNAIMGGIHINSAADINFSSASSSYDFTRSFMVDVEGDSDSSFASDITFMATNSFTIDQDAGPTSLDNVFFSGNNEIITLSDSFSQNYGSTTFDVGSSFTVTASEGDALVDSTFSSYFEIASSVMMDASGSNGTIWFTSLNDVHGSSTSGTTISGDIINISSSWAETISSTSNNGNIVVTSGGASPISWNSVETFNVTALNGLFATASGEVDNVGIWFAAKDTVQSEMDLNARNGIVEAISLDSQSYSADKISLSAGQDITFTNFFPPLEVGGVRFITAGSAHDGTYEDETGISVRSHWENAEIYFSVTAGASAINAGSDIHNEISDARGFWTADENITFMASNGDIALSAEQGDVILQSNLASVTFVTDANTELQAYDSIHTLTGKAISLISTDPIMNGNDDNNLSFDFSALEGNIITSAVVSQPIIFEGNDFDITSNEEMYFLAADDLPFLTNTGGINVNAKTGIYLKVDGGDLDITASDEIFLSSSENFDTRIESGNDMVYLALAEEIQISSIIDTQIRSLTGDILFSTFDSEGDILITSEGEIRFQADGTDDNIGASQVDGIFVDAPQIQASATDDILFEAYTAFTVGANTRPVVSFEAGGSSTGPGVIFNAEGNILHSIGQNFLFTSNGAMLWESHNMDITSSGAISMTTTGSLLEGQDIIMQSDQKTSVSADNISIQSGTQVAFATEGVMQIESNSLIDLSIAGTLNTQVREKYDVNAGAWDWTVLDSFSLDTRGDVVISNGLVGGISVYGDSDVSFTSDVVSEFLTFGEASPISLTTNGGTSTLAINSDSSDILFETAASFTATSISTSSFASNGEIQITAPLNSLYSAADSTIDLISAGDLNFSSDRDLTFEGAEGLNITSVSDMSLSVDGFMYIQAWQDGYFVSKQESLSFSTDFNITFANRNGDITLTSTRDIKQTVADDAIFVFDGDYSISAAESYEIITSSLYAIDNIAENAEITFTSQNGILEWDIVGDIDLSAGDVYFTATQGAATLDITADFDITTEGLHNKITFAADAGVLTFSASDNTITNLFTFNSPLDLPIDTPSQRNGNGFMDFTADGVNPDDGYSMRIEAADFDLFADRGVINFFSAANLDFSTTGTLDVLCHSHVAEGFMITALSPGASAIFDSELGSIDLIARRNLEITADESITFNAFDSFFVDANASSTSAEFTDLLIKATHPAGDINITTTDFLTADIIFDFNGDVEIYSEKETTFFLLDDDDTAQVGTYLIDADGSINMAAENDFTITEVGPGDIEITDLGGELFFTAGNEILVTVRQVLELDVDRIDIEAERDFFISGDNIEFDVQSITMSGEGDMVISGDDHLFSGSTSLVISTSDTDVDLSSSDVGQEIIMNAIVDTRFATGDVSIEVPPHRTIDFRDGLIIPRVSIGAATGVGCPFADRSLFYDTGTNNICYCNLGNSRCLNTFSHVRLY